MSRLCGELERAVKAFRERRLGEYRCPYVWLDAKVEQVREGGRIVNMALLVAIAVNERGERQVLGLEVGAAETAPLWTGFLRSLVVGGCPRHLRRPSRAARGELSPAGPTSLSGRAAVS